MIIQHREQPASIDVDRTRCVGRSLCSLTLPERITADEWGYPIIDQRPIDREAATEAVHSCPVRALRLRER